MTEEKRKEAREGIARMREAAREVSRSNDRIYGPGVSAATLELSDELVELCARAMRDAEPTGYREHARAVLRAALASGELVPGRELEEARDAIKKLCAYVDDAAGPVSCLIPVATLEKISAKNDRLRAAERELEECRERLARLAKAIEVALPEFEADMPLDAFTDDRAPVHIDHFHGLQQGVAYLKSELARWALAPSPTEGEQ